MSKSHRPARIILPADFDAVAGIIDQRHVGVLRILYEILDASRNSSRRHEHAVDVEAEIAQQIVDVARV